MEIGPSKPGGFTLNEPANRRIQKEETDQTNNRLEPAAAPTDTDRLLEIRQRIETGYYDQFWVKEKMIDKMIDEMLKNISEFYK